MRRLLAALLFIASAARADRRFDPKDAASKVPLPKGSLLVVGFLGGWEEWDNPKRSVRKLALSLRDRNLPGVFVETAGNHDRAAVLKLIRKAMDQNRNRKLDAEEKKSVQIILYGQSFGGAACVKLARELDQLGIPVRLTVQVDSIGRDDDWIPPNVSRALNLYQRDPGPFQGEPEIKAVDPSRTTILGNFRFFYFFRNVDMSDYPRIAQRVGLAHWKMDNDPVVWKQVELAILAEIAAWEASRLVTAP
jgi:pimeloyl-ACP methyl ester carboxylesterase